MAVAVFEIPDTPSRMLSKKEAAAYCRIPINKFPIVCPVTPLDMGAGVRAYDIKDLDEWIDRLKGREHPDSDDDILAKLDAAK